MAKKSVKNRNLKREKYAVRYAERRSVLVSIIKDPSASSDEKAAAYKKIHSMPRDASACRIHNRCSITGRPRGFYRKFGVSRIVFRELAHEGFLPGVRKASW